MANSVTRKETRHPCIWSRGIREETVTYRDGVAAPEHVADERCQQRGKCRLDGRICGRGIHTFACSAQCMQHKNTCKTYPTSLVWLAAPLTPVAAQHRQGTDANFGVVVDKLLGMRLLVLLHATLVHRVVVAKQQQQQVPEGAVLQQVVLKESVHRKRADAVDGRLC